MVSRLPLICAFVMIAATPVAAQGLTPTERERQLFQAQEWQLFQETSIRSRLIAIDVLDDRRLCKLANRCEAEGQSHYDGADRSRAAQAKESTTVPDR